MSYPLIVVIGPTGSGKSGLAVDLALTFCGEVLNCDSVQIYRGLNIGTAKLTAAEQCGVAHHLIDVADLGDLFTAGEFLSRGRLVLNDIRVRQHLPIVAGGSGLYLRALLRGLFPGPKRSEPLRARLYELATNKGTTYLHRLLARVDATSASRIAVNDQPKLVRALEVFFLTGVPISEQFQKGAETLQGFNVLKIGLNPPRKDLYELIDRRVERMFADGLLEEIRALLSDGWAPELKPLQSLGYAQVIQHLKGKISVQQAISQIQLETRHYARRQLTWFRKEDHVVWFGGFGSDSEVRRSVKGHVEAFLENLREEGCQPSG